MATDSHDAALVQAVSDGDQEAFEVLLARHYPLLLPRCAGERWQTRCWRKTPRKRRPSGPCSGSSGCVVRNSSGRGSAASG